MMPNWRAFWPDGLPHLVSGALGCVQQKTVNHAARPTSLPFEMAGAEFTYYLSEDEFVLDRRFEFGSRRITLYSQGDVPKNCESSPLEGVKVGFDPAGRQCVTFQENRSVERGHP